MKNAQTVPTQSANDELSPDMAGRETRIAQDEVYSWINSLWGKEAAGKKERCRRFLEEALELVQSCDFTRGQAEQILEYVYNRPVEPKVSKEVGGSFSTLLALGNAVDVDVWTAYLADKKHRWENASRIKEKQLQKINDGVSDKYA